MIRFALRAAAVVTVLTALGLTIGLRPESISNVINDVLAVTTQQAPAVDAPDGKAPPLRLESGERVQITTCTVNLVLDPNVGADAARRIREAARRYTESSPFTVTVNRRGPGVRVAYEDLDGDTAARALNQVHLTDDGPMAHPQNILMDSAKLEAMSPDEQLNVLMHEIGHLLGLGHSPHAESFMYPYVTYVNALTRYEIRGLQRAGKACRPMNSP